MTIILIGKKYYSIPTCWNDLTRSQLLRIMKVFDSSLTIEKANIKFLQILTGISWFRLLLNPIDAMEYLHLVEFLYSPEPEQYLTQNKLPAYYDGCMNFGPADALDNVCALEFFWAHHYYEQWVNDREAGALDMMIATLYRPGRKKYDHDLNPDGDRRELYNEKLTGKYAQYIAKWDKEEKHAIAKFFEHSFLTLRNKYPDPFEGGGELSRFGFYSVLRGVADRGTHGKFKEVEAMNVHTFFIELSEITIADRKLSK